MLVFEPVEVEDCPVELALEVPTPVAGNIEPIPPSIVPKSPKLNPPIV
jgi:hypothetical protein